MNVVKFSSSRTDRSEIEAQAQAWVIRLDGEQMRCGELRQLNDWLGRSPQHQEVFRAAAACWMSLDRLNLLLDQAQVLGQEARSRRVRPGRLKLASCALALCAGAAMLSPGLPWVERDVAVTEYRTAIGEIRTLDLPDGSSISLNTNSRVSVSYQDEARFIHLSEGEAFFEVAHDPERPFLVYAGQYAVRAVGTAFSVHSGDEELDVIVADGRIEVSSFGEELAGPAEMSLDHMREPATLVPLDKGQMGVFSGDMGKLELIDEVDSGGLDKSLSWRDGMLIFDNDSLESVVAELNRYTPMRIVISDSSIRGLLCVGAFPVGNIPAILTTLEDDYDIQVDRVTPDLVYLSRAKDSVL